MLFITVAGLAVAVCLTLVLVPPLQARGAAAAFAAGEVTVAALTFVALRIARADIGFSLRVPLRVLIAAILGGAVILVPGLTSLLDAIIGCVAYAVVLVVSRAVPDELMQALRRRQRPLTP